MNTTVQKFTANQLLKMPHDGYRRELVKGELKMMTPAGSVHGVITIKLTLPLAQHVEANRLGVVMGAETGFQIATAPDTVLAPDIAFVRSERIPVTGPPEGYWLGAPDLAVEVLSPSDSASEMEQKVGSWLAAGASMVWVVNPKRRVIRVHRPQVHTETLTDNDTLDGQEVVPGFCCRVAKIFD